VNLALPEILIGAIIVGLLVSWIMGVVKLFHKNQRVLAWIAIVGIIVPIVALVGYAGWFVDPKAD
jgi:cytochrome bd-type quinol oxidase subunit 1